MVFDKIAHSTAVRPEMLDLIHLNEGRMAYFTESFDGVRAEGTNFDYLYLLDGASIIRSNIRHWLSSRAFSLHLLSNAAAEAFPNVLILTMRGAD